MGCVSQNDLLEYAEGRLLHAQLAETEAHLRGCDSCRRVVAALAQSSSPDPPSSHGQLIGRYEVLGPIGAGGMGVVYAARDPKLRRTVALKMLRPGGQDDANQAKMRQRLLREARAMAQLSHPNVLPVYDVGEAGEDVFVAMELVEGGTLRTWLSAKRRSWREVLEIFLDAARGLAAAHMAGLIHRDFKPDNVLVGKDGRVRVTDFGLASAAAPGAQVSEGQEWDVVLSLTGTALAGSPAYMAPEQMRGETVDARADVFSYCVALHEGLYGERPFAGESVAELESAILRGEVRKPRRATGTPTWTRRAIRRGLHAAPADRFQSMDAVIAALENKRGWKTRAALVGFAVSVLAALAWLASPLVRANPARHEVPPANEQVQSVAASVRSEEQTATTSRSESEDLLLRGSIQLRHATLEDNLAAIQLLEQAVSIDPNSAAAHAELARAYGMRVAWFAPDDKNALERAELAEAKALRLNPDLPEAHHAAGELLWTAIPPRFAHERAAREHLRAIALNPDFADAHHALGMIYQHIGLLDLAMNEYRKATELDPTTQNPTRRLAMTLVSLGQYEEGLRTFRQVPPEANSSVWHYELAWTLLYLGRRQEAWNLMEGYLQAHPEDRGGVVTSTRAIWFASAGHARRAEADIRTAIEKGKGFVHFHHTAYNVASAYALLGRAELAVRWLRTAAEGGWPCYPHFANDPNLARIRADDRFVDFMNDLKKQWERYRAMF